MAFYDNWFDSKSTSVSSSSQDTYNNTLMNNSQSSMPKEKPFGVLLEDMNPVDFNFDTNESVSNIANNLTPSLASIGVDSAVSTTNSPVGNFDPSSLLSENNDFTFAALGSTALLGSTELLIARSAFPAVGAIAGGIAAVASSPVVLGALGVAAVGTAGYYLYDQFSTTEPIDNNYVGGDHLIDRDVPGSGGELIKYENEPRDWSGAFSDKEVGGTLVMPGASLDGQIISGDLRGGTLDPSLDPSITTPKPLSDFDFSTPIMMSVKKPEGVVQANIPNIGDNEGENYPLEERGDHNWLSETKNLIETNPSVIVNIDGEPFPIVNTDEDATRVFQQMAEDRTDKLVILGPNVKLGGLPEYFGVRGDITNDAQEYFLGNLNLDALPRNYESDGDIPPSRYSPTVVGTNGNYASVVPMGFGQQIADRLSVKVHTHPDRSNAPSEIDIKSQIKRFERSGDIYDATGLIVAVDDLTLKPMVSGFMTDVVMGSYEDFQDNYGGRTSIPNLDLRGWKEPQNKTIVPSWSPRPTGGIGYGNK